MHLKVSGQMSVRNHRYMAANLANQLALGHMSTKTMPFSPLNLLCWIKKGAKSNCGTHLAKE